MKFTKLRFKNFLSFGNTITEINLDSNLTTLITGENGAGKTTAMEALYFAITGKPYRKIKKEHLINNINNKELYTEVEFNHDNHEYVIKRGIKPNIFELYRDVKLIDQDAATKDYQKILENLIGIDADTFSKTIFISSKNYEPFLKMNAADKRNFIENVLNIRIFTEILDQVKIKRSLQAEKHNEIEFRRKNTIDKKNVAIESNEKYSQNIDQEIKDLNDKIKAEQSGLSDFEDELKRIEAWLEKNEFQSKIDELKQSINTEREKEKTIYESVTTLFEEKQSKLSAELKTRKDSYLEINAKQVKLFSSHNKLESEYDSLVRTHTAALKEIEQTINNDIVNLKNAKETENIYKQQELDKILEHKKFFGNHTVCPQCQQEINPDNKNMADILKKIDKDIDALEKSIAANNKEVTKRVKELENTLKQQKNEIDEKYQTLKAECKERIETSSKEMARIEESLNTLNLEVGAIELKLQTLDNEKKQMINYRRSEISTAINEIEEKMKPIQANIDKANKRQQEINNCKSKIDTAIEMYQARIEELSKTDKKELVDISKFDKELVEIEKELVASDYYKETINEMIKILSDKGIKSYIVKKYIPTLNQLTNKYLEIFSAPYRISFDEQFDINIASRGYEKLGYGSLSSGEEQRVDLALLFAFYELGKLKNSINSNILLLDEISDKSLDKAGLDGLFMIFETMKTKGMTIFNISHRPEVKDRFDKAFEVNKARFSQLREI
jgi:DNA repair exonuclease SbcCD ATPase subunit